MLSCTKIINDKYPILSYCERIFADYVLDNKTQVIYMSIAQLAETLGIAASTVIAAAKKLGYSGFKELKISLAAEQINPTEHWKRHGAASEFTKANWYEKVIDTNVTVLEESVRSLPYASLDKAAEALLHASTIHIYGVGTSGILAREAYDFFFRLCLPCIIHEENTYQRLSISMLKETDVALLITQSGVNREIVSLAEQITRRGVPLIGISNYMGTPFSKFCSILLAALPTVSAVHDNHFSLRVPILCILEALFYALSEKMGDRYHTALTINQEVITDASIASKQAKPQGPL